MSEVWQSYASAPDEGALICKASDVADGVARCFTGRTQKGEFPLLLVRRDGMVSGFVNACPHQYLPLNYRWETILSADGCRLICSAHGATFDVGTGDCLSGGVEGLNRVPIFEDAEGNLRFGSRPRTAQKL